MVLFYFSSSYCSVAHVQSQSRWRIGFNQDCDFARCVSWSEREPRWCVTVVTGHGFYTEKKRDVRTPGVEEQWKRGVLFRLNTRGFLIVSQIWKQSEKRLPPPLKKNSDFGPAEACFASRVKAVFNKVMRMLGYVLRLFAGKYLTYLFFFSKLLKIAFRLPSLPFLISLSLFPLRAPFIVSRHWNTAPN